MIILDGPSGNGIGKNISKILKMPYASVEYKIFPDGESYIRIPTLPKDDSVVVVQSTFAPQEKHILELVFIADTLKKMGVRQITAVIPYLAYTRQNKSFRENESVGINSVARLLKDSGIDSIVTVEPHTNEIKSVFGAKVKILGTSELFAKALAKVVSNPFVISTDKGDLERAKSLAKLLKCDYDFIEKERDIRTNEVRAKTPIKSDLNGKEAIIFDDVISTGGTIELAARLASSKGAKKIIVAAAHLVMAGDAYERIVNAGVKEIYGTNTVPFPKAKIIDISEEIAKALK